MWNVTSSWQRRTRTLAGGVTLAAIVIVPALLLARAGGAPALQVRDALRSASTLVGGSERTFAIDLAGAPADLAALLSAGAAIHAEDDEGSAQIVGRIVPIDSGLAALLPPALADACRGGCELLVARPVDSLGDTLALLFAPDGVEGEIALARQRLRPALEGRLLTGLRSRLDETIAELLSRLPREHGEELSVIGEDLRVALEEPSEELIGALADRSWETIGYWGLTKGVARASFGKARSMLTTGANRTLGLVGLKDEEWLAPPPPPSPFLSDDAREELRIALEGELTEFWRREGETLMSRAGEVLSRHRSSTLAGIEAEWLAELETRVLQASWEDSRDEILQALSDYTTDLAGRRLLAGGDPARGDRDLGPTLPLAYAIRSATGITRQPLVALQRSPETGGSSTGRRPAIRVRDFEQARDPDRRLDLDRRAAQTRGR